MTKPKKRASPKGKNGVVVRVEKINNESVLMVGPDNLLFRHYADQWYRETGHMSLTRDIAVNENYQYIIGLGESVIPLVLNELQERGGHWFWALKYLCRVNPVKHEDMGNVQKMREIWLKWGRANGYIG